MSPHSLWKKAASSASPPPNSTPKHVGFSHKMIVVINAALTTVGFGVAVGVYVASSEEGRTSSEKNAGEDAADNSKDALIAANDDDVTLRRAPRSRHQQFETIVRRLHFADSV